MPEEGFLRRWARVKASAPETVVDAPRPPAVPVTAPAPPQVRADGPDAPRPPAPTLVDAEGLTAESDFSAFVSPNVGQDVRRLALKKLFADPHFNVLDRLDMYMDDYNKPDPVSATMLAALDHARGVLRRPEEVQAEIARLRAREEAPADAEPGAPAAPEEGVPVPDDADRAAVPGEAAIIEGDDDPDADASSPPAHAAGSDSDVIALTSVDAHNTQASV